MVEQTQMPVNRVAVPPAFRPAAATAVLMLTPKEIVGILRRHVLLIILMTVLGAISGGVAWHFLLKYLPKYTAQTFLRVLSPVEKDPMTIGTAQLAKDILYEARLSIAALIKRQSTLQKLIERDKIQKTQWFKGFGEIRDRQIAKAVKALDRKFGAYAQRDSDYVILSMTCGDRVEAALIVNEMLDLFLSLQGSTKREEISERLARLEEERIRVQRDLDSAERALDDVRKRYGFTDLEEHQFQHTITQKLNNLELEQNALIMQIRQIQANIFNLEKQATGPINEQIERQVEGDPTMIMLTQQLVLQEAHLAGRLTKFGENHREVRQLQELINETKQRRQLRQSEIGEQTRQSNLKDGQDYLIVLVSRLEELEKMRKQAEAKNTELDFARVQYEQRATIRDERKQMLDDVKGQVEKLKIMHDDPETPKIRSVGYAPVPLEVSSPKLGIYLPGGTVLGFVLGLGLTFLIELLNDLVRTPKDVSRYLRIPLLGVIPNADEDEQVRDIDLCHVVRFAPYSIISESYRRFRTNLKLSASAVSSKVLLISSAMAGDGKTSVAANLTATLIVENKKVLLIDASFWRPNLHKVFSKTAAEKRIVEQSDLGLSSLLMGKYGFGEVIRSGGMEGLDVIDSGPLPSNPAELLSSKRMEDLIKEQRQNYDYVIVDGPPILLVNEAKMLAKHADGTILVFNAGTTRRGVAQRTIRELREADTTITGCVLFNVKALKGGYFREQFKFYREYQKPLLVRTT